MHVQEGRQYRYNISHVTATCCTWSGGSSSCIHAEVGVNAVILPPTSEWKYCQNATSPVEVERHEDRLDAAATFVAEHGVPRQQLDVPSLSRRTLVPVLNLWVGVGGCSLAVVVVRMLS